MTDVSYVRTEMLQEKLPPRGQTGVTRWLRENMFSNIPNSLLSIAAIYGIYLLLNATLPWIFQSSWSVGSLGECREAISAIYGEGTDGACWAVIRERFRQLMFGFYPRDQYWRPVLAFVLMLAAISPVLFSSIPRKVLWFSASYPFIAFLLYWGGSVWIPIGVIAGFGIAYLAVTLLPNFIGSLASTIAAILLPIFWWMFAIVPIDTALNTIVGDMRMPRLIATQEYLIDIAKVSDEKRKAAGKYLVDLEELPEQKEQLIALMAEAETLRGALPDSVRKITELRELGTDISSADKEAASAVIRTESDVVALRKSISTTYAVAGRIGLQPIESSAFGGFMLSIIIGVTGIALSLPIGILLALGRQSHLFVVKTICVGFIEFIRGVPLITLLFVASTLLNYFMPPGTNFDLILRVIIMVTLFASAYMAEVIRGGLAALPKGQYEAADALGLDFWKATRLIIMPQALKITIPSIVSTFIGLFKDTTLVSIIGLLDPMGLTNAIRANQAWNGIVWELYGFIALMFWIVCFSMSRYSMYLERKLATGH